jgi:hypothetical protein
MRGTCSAGEFEATAGDECCEDDDWPVKGWTFGRGSIKLSAEDEEPAEGVT